MELRQAGEKRQGQIGNWKAEARALGTEYDELVSRRADPPFPLDVYEVEDRLREIRRRKYELLKETKAAHLSSRERADIENPMELIPPP